MVLTNVRSRGRYLRKRSLPSDWRTSSRARSGSFAVKRFITELSIWRKLPPLTPDPSPPAGARGEPVFPPSPPLRGRGVGGEGVWEASAPSPPTPLPRGARGVIL